MCPFADLESQAKQSYKSQGDYYPAKKILKELIDIHGLKPL